MFTVQRLKFMTSLCGRGALTPLLATFSLFAFATTCLTAAPIQQDLGQGLAYFRVTNAPADLPGDAGKQPCVLDLRYARADANAPQLLSAWLRVHAQSEHPVFVLANNSTAPALLRILADNRKVPGLLTVGIAAPAFSPDFPVSQSPAEEQRAFDDFAKGTSVTELTTDNPQKQRNDEASLSRDAQADTAETEAATKPSDTPDRATHIDAALQRAIQLHRGLKALKRIE
jgi:hypothetical protein